MYEYIMGNRPCLTRIRDIPHILWFNMAIACYYPLKWTIDEGWSLETAESYKISWYLLHAMSQSQLHTCIYIYIIVIYWYIYNTVDKTCEQQCITCWVFWLSWPGCDDSSSQKKLIIYGDISQWQSLCLGAASKQGWTTQLLDSPKRWLKKRQKQYDCYITIYYCSFF